MKQKIYDIINKNISKNCQWSIFIGVISYILFIVFWFQNIGEEYFQNQMIGSMPIGTLIVSAIVMNFVKDKRKVLCWNQCCLVVVQFVGLIYYNNLSTISTSCVRLFESGFKDYDSYVMTALLLIDIAAIFVARYFNKFWYSLYIGIKVVIFISAFIFMLCSEYILLYDAAQTISYLFYYIAILVLIFDNEKFLFSHKSKGTQD